MLLLSYRNSATLEEAGRKQALIAYFLLILGMWTGIFLYFSARNVFYIILPVHIFFVLSSPAGLYILVSNLITGRFVRKYLYFHCLPGMILGFLSGLFIFFSPVSLSLLNEKIIHCLLAGNFLSSLVYFTLVCYRLFRRNLELQSIHPENILLPANWIVLQIFLSFLILFNTAIPVFLSDDNFLYWVYGGAVMISVQFIILIYNLICPHYPVFKDTGKRMRVIAPEKEYFGIPAPVPQVKNFVLSRKNFEAIFVNNKLYTNPNTSLETLVELLDIDQPTLSAFIRSTYNMNFPQYLNELRLNELEQLLSLPSNTGKRPSELITQAGFGSLRSYQRYKLKHTKRIASEE